MPGTDRLAASGIISMSSSSSPSVYHSAHIESMIESRSLFSKEVEFEIESSEVHWSVLSSTYHPESDRNHFEVLKEILNVGAFSGILRVGKGINEGAQAEILSWLVNPSCQCLSCNLLQSNS